MGSAGYPGELTVHGFRLEFVAGKTNCVISTGLRSPSEQWGDGWARMMDATHVLVDPDRTRFPISATMLRDDLGANFHWLVPAARANLSLATRISTRSLRKHGPTYTSSAPPDFDWVQDGTRESDHQRHWMHQAMAGRARASGAEVAVLTGPPEQRLDRALELVRPLTVFPTLT